MADFRRRPQHELAHLPDQGLVDYIDEAREAGDPEAVCEATGYLAYAFEGQIRARIVAKVDPGDVEDVMMETLHSVIRAGFDGKLIGQFGALVRTITQRRIADYHRARERVPGTDPIVEEQADDEQGGTQVGVAEETWVVDMTDAIDRVIASRSEVHQRVIRLYGPGVCGFDDLSAAEVCDRLAADGDAMSVDNVAQIWRRFKRDLQRELDA